MPVHSLYIVLASAIGLQFPRSYASPFLCMSTVHDSFHAVGVLPVIHMSTNSLNSLCIAAWAASGRCFRSSLGMLSGPALFLFGSLLTCWWQRLGVPHTVQQGELANLSQSSGGTVTFGREVELLLS